MPKSQKTSPGSCHSERSQNLPLNLPLKVRGTKGVISIIFITPLAPLTLRGAGYEIPNDKGQMTSEAQMLKSRNLPLKVRGTKGVISIIFITPLAPLTLRGVILSDSAYLSTSRAVSES